MSKKHKKQQQISSGSPEKTSNAYLNHAAEYRVIKHDLLRVLALNVIYLAGVLVIYYTNLQTHYLENWFDKILHF